MIKQRRNDNRKILKEMFPRDIGHPSSQDLQEYALQVQPLSIPLVHGIPEQPERPERKKKHLKNKETKSKGKKSTSQSKKPDEADQTELTSPLTSPIRESDNIQDDLTDVSELSSSPSRAQALKQLAETKAKKTRNIRNEDGKRLQQSQSSLDSGYQQTTNEESRRKDEEIEHLHSEVSFLKKDNEYLKSIINKMKAHKETVSRNTSKEQIEVLEVKNRDLVEDVAMLKKLVFRLNVELGRYQDKFIRANISPPQPDKSYSAIPDWTLRASKLAPLLDAYEETLKDKDELIRSYEHDMKKFTVKCKEIVEENERLYDELEEANKKGEVTFAEWRILRQDAADAQEQNELLEKKVKLQKEKLGEVYAAYEQKVSDLLRELENLHSQYKAVVSELHSVKEQYNSLKLQNGKLRSDAEKKIPLEEHNESIIECKRLFEQLKASYSEDRSNFMSQIQAVEMEKAKLELQVVDIRGERSQLQTQVKTFEKLLKKCQHKCDDLQNKVIMAQQEREHAKRQLQKAMTFAEELVVEQERLLKKLHSKQEENDTMTKLGNKIANRMGSLKNELKTVQKGAKQELDEIEKHIRKQESGVEKMKGEYEKEVLRLRHMIKQKEAIIAKLQKERRLASPFRMKDESGLKYWKEKLKINHFKAQQELEVIWRSATIESHNIEESLRQSGIVPERDNQP